MECFFRWAERCTPLILVGRQGYTEKSCLKKERKEKRKEKEKKRIAMFSQERASILTYFTRHSAPVVGILVGSPKQLFSLTFHVVVYTGL